MRRASIVILALTLASLWLGGPGAWAAPTAQVDEPAIREFVRYANSDPIYSEAYRTTNADLLRPAWRGEALLDMEDDLQGMRASGQFLDLQLEMMDFQRIQELGPGRVRVVTLERWLARLHEAGGTYLGYSRQLVENRYLVERLGDEWYIIEADQEIRGGDPVFRPGDPPALP